MLCLPFSFASVKAKLSVDGIGEEKMDNGEKSKYEWGKRNKFLKGWVGDTKSFPENM